jgi:ADP-ribosyl-[dinitrogen reductase] hydrolase
VSVEKREVNGTDPERLDRAQGCLLGQLIGDALGSLVEFETPERIRSRYPDGVRDLHDGGTWNTIAGQPTDDSELALALARAILRTGGYDADVARDAYLRWYHSSPFDLGSTIIAGLSGTPNYDSQSNGALMRISPLGIVGAGADPDLVARWAREDAWMTHPNEVTQDANVLFVLTIAHAIERGPSPGDAYRQALHIADEHGLAESVRLTLDRAAVDTPVSYVDRQGWVLIALQNAYYQLTHATHVEDALVDTIMRGGDTDTNAAISGALLGAIHGRAGIPERWVKVILDCRPTRDDPRVRRPRPEEYWPVDALELAEQLLASSPSD